MAETRFIKTVEFGGYDRNEVIKRLEFLNGQVFDLRNELRETKLIMEEYKKGSDEEKAHETVLAQEKVKLTSLQVQNETNSAKLKAAEEDKAKLAEELAALKESHAAAVKELEDVKSKLSAYESDDEAAALSQVFIAAQQSANALVGNANKEAEDKKAAAEALVKEMLEDANHTAAEIIYEAEKKAAETDAETKNSAEKMKVANNNLRASMLTDVEELSKQMAALNEALAAITERSAEAEKLLKETESKLTEGGIPEFKVPELVEADLPEAPESRKAGEQPKKSNAKLEELMKQASALKGGETENSEADNADEKAEGSAEEKTEEKTDETAEDAEKTEEKKPEENKAAEGGKKSGVDLSALLKQANELKK
ncbi:MAG: plectin [Ruminococcus albus]|nr:plectin [Ruminococcus albus]